MRLFTFALALVLSHVSIADWSLQQPSSIHFLTNKNTHFVETHSFNEFTGKINKSGNATLAIELSSVDTRIAIRDERMEKHLFEVSQFAQATFEADIPTAVLEQVSAGTQTRYELTGKVSLHGEHAKTECQVMISPNSDGTITVTSITPMIIDAESFDLIAGINKSQEIAGLKSITRTVSVTSILTFKAD